MPLYCYLIIICWPLRGHMPQTNENNTCSNDEANQKIKIGNFKKWISNFVICGGHSGLTPVFPNAHTETKNTFGEKHFCANALTHLKSCLSGVISSFWFHHFCMCIYSATCTGGACTEFVTVVWTCASLRMLWRRQTSQWCCATFADWRLRTVRRCTLLHPSPSSSPERDPLFAAATESLPSHNTHTPVWTHHIHIYIYIYTVKSYWYSKCHM